MYAAPEGISAAEFAGLQPELARAHGVVRDKTRAGLDAEFACLNLPELMAPQLAEIERAAVDIRRYRDVVVAGIGGSSLGAKAVYYAL
ncbi:MAG: glucose-6-phosphate isomerase, partial [Pseudomonadota bacterium]